jgi:hypothetical protein
MDDATLNRVLTICCALQKACKGQVISMQRQPLNSERVLFTFKLDEGGTEFANTCYSEGYFDEDTADLKHLGQRIYFELTNRFESKMKSTKGRR